MFSSLAVTLGLLAQVSGSPRLLARVMSAPADPVTVWRSDSTVYVKLRDPGHLVLLHVDAIGRIQVLFPETPGDNTSIAADTPVPIVLPPTAQANPATFVAVRSRWAFEFAALLGAGSDWDYQDAWLLQPTAGDPLAALLDIADRITDGRPYEYGVIAYSREGAVSTRRTPLQPDVCLSCVRHGTLAAAVATSAGQTNTVDCSNGAFTNSFCGVNNGSVSISTEQQPQQVAYEPPAPAPVYVPYYVPIHRLGARFEFHEHDPRPMRIPQQGVAYPIAPRLIVPSSAQIHTFGGRRH
jgi:hypothetical protein